MDEEVKAKMDESKAYKWAAQAARHVNGLVEMHTLQRLVDSIAAAILEAYKIGAYNHPVHSDKKRQSASGLRSHHCVSCR